MSMETDLATQRHAIEGAAERLCDEFPLQLCLQRDDGNELYTQEPILPVALMRPEPLTVLGATVRENQHKLTAFVLKEAAGCYGLTAAEILTNSRLQHRVRARQTASYILRESMGLSYPSIGQIIGGRHHTSVISSVEKVQRAIDAKDSTFDNGFIQRTIDLVREASINNPETDEPAGLEHFGPVDSHGHRLIFVDQSGLVAADLARVDNPIAVHFNVPPNALAVDLDTVVNEQRLYETWGIKAEDLLRRLDSRGPIQAS